jgi:hypothetical protein
MYRQKKKPGLKKKTHPAFTQFDGKGTAIKISL